MLFQKLFPLLAVIFTSVTATAGYHAGQPVSATLTLTKTLALRGEVQIGNGAFGGTQVVSLPPGIYKVATNTASESHHGGQCLIKCSSPSATKIYEMLTLNPGAKNSKTIRYLMGDSQGAQNGWYKMGYARQSFYTLSKSSVSSKKGNYREEETECQVKSYCSSWDCVYAIGTMTQSMHDILSTTNQVTRFLTTGGTEVGTLRYLKHNVDTEVDSQSKCVLNNQ